MLKTKPIKPLKGQGYARHSFEFDRRLNSDKEKCQFWDALPADHKVEVCVARRKKGYFSFGKFISPEAFMLWEGGKDANNG